MLVKKTERKTQSPLDSHLQPSQFTKKGDCHVTLQFIVGTDH